MGCELCAIDSMSVGDGEPPQDGLKLSVEEVEEAFCLHPAVRDCVVMEVPDRINGERFVVFVTLQAKLIGREQELRDWARYKIGDHSVPERIVILPTLPNGPPGTVDSSALKDLIRSFETGLDIVSS